MGILRTAGHWGAYRVHPAENGKVRLEADEGDRDPSPIGPSMAAVQDTLRVGYPMVRAGYLRAPEESDGTGRGYEPFVRVSWEYAIELASDALLRAKKESGNQSIYAGSYGWASAGRFHHALSQLHRFMNGFGGYTASTNTYSTAAAEVILPHVIGNRVNALHQSPRWVQVAESCELFVAFGGLALKNSQINESHVGRHGVRGHLDACRDSGVSFVNVSPQRDDVAADLDAQWMATRPNTDTALMLGLAYHLWEHGKVDYAFLERCTVGFDRFRPYLTGECDGIPKSPAWASSITGIPAANIALLAERMATHRTMISVAWSLQRADRGEQPYWMGIVLAAMLGQIGRRGAGIGFGYAGMNGIGEPLTPFKWGSLPQGHNPVSPPIPVARVADMLLNPGGQCSYNGLELTYPDIRLIYWAGGNPFHHHQDLNRLEKAWSRPETIIVNEPWWTPVARRADIVFPVTTALERNDISCGSQDRFISPMHQALEPYGASRSDFEIFSNLAESLGFGESFSEGRDELEWVKHLYETSRVRADACGVSLPDFDTFWDGGQLDIPMDDAGVTPLEEFARAPEAHPLDTPTGKIEIYSQTIARMTHPAIPPHPTWAEPYEWLGGSEAKEYPLHLVSNQPARRLHSQGDHGPFSVGGKIHGHEPARLNPADAGSRGIADGDIVRLYNARGACLCGAKLTEDVMPGVVQLSTGAWPDMTTSDDGQWLEIHGNPNVLTRDQGCSPLSQGPSPLTTLVEVERFDATKISLKPFESPLIATG